MSREFHISNSHFSLLYNIIISLTKYYSLLNTNFLLKKLSYIKENLYDSLLNIAETCLRCNLHGVSIETDLMCKPP